MVVILSVGFVKAIHAGDSLFVLTQGFENMDPATLDTATIINAYKKSKSENFIVNLQGDKPQERNFGHSAM